MEREKIIANEILKEFCEEGMIVLDGRKNNWATPSMKEFVLWKEGMTPEEFEKEYDYYHICLSQDKMTTYVPLWKQNNK